MSKQLDALFSKTQRHVLGLLFGHPDDSFSVSELIKAVRSGSGSVQREIAKLAHGGLITMTPVGNQKRYQANPESQVFEELRRMFWKLEVRWTPPRSRAQPDSEFVD